MTHTFRTERHHIAGERIVFPFKIDNEDGSDKDISSSAIDWYLVPSKGDPDSDAVLDDSSSGISLTVVDASRGRIDLKISSGTTSDFGGESWWQRLEIEDSDGKMQKWGAHFPIQKE